MTIGFHACPLPRGVRRGDLFAVKCYVCEASGGHCHRVVAICTTEADARVCARTLQRKRGRR